MKIKQAVFKEILYHFVVFFIINILFLLLMHIRIIKISNIYFYDGIIALIAAVFPIELICFFIRKHLNWDIKDLIISVLLSISFLFVFLSLILVSLDRSYSVFLLSYMDNHYESNEIIKKDELDAVMKNIFIDEYDMLGRRFEEQVASGNIFESNEGVLLTDRGHFVTEIFKIIGKLYGVDRRYYDP